MLLDIIEIQKWFKENIGNNVPDGTYSVPINEKIYEVKIKNNKIISIDQGSQQCY
jgi:hypothetical protein